MNVTKIDMQTYPRRAHFEYFRSLAYPYVGTTVNVDVTALKAFCKRTDCSFYLAFLHAAALAADRVPEFRMRICGKQIVQYDTCGTSHIEILEGDTYCYCTLYHDKPWQAYLAYAEKTRADCRAHGSIEEDAEVDNLYFVSAIPWLHYTALTQPVGGDESNPRITCGKFEADFRGRLMLPVTVLVHHALVDGVHIAAFYRNLDEEIAKISEG